MNLDKKPARKLTLNRESLLRLEDRELQRVAAGFSGSGECTHGPSNCGKCTYHC
ncbi:MAG TPA: hypothetical protein VHQ90_21510 [Thermoanaerobaculia bacterium]|nr:hypothetical protein [Thermoanaerobaculia bacterium]